MARPRRPVVVDLEPTAAQPVILDVPKRLTRDEAQALVEQLANALDFLDAVPVELSP